MVRSGVLCLQDVFALGGLPGRWQTLVIVIRTSGMGAIRRRSELDYAIAAFGLPQSCA